MAVRRRSTRQSARSASEQHPDPSSGDALESLVSNPDKTLWPDDGLTKRDLVRYYQSIAGVLLPHLRDRPLVMKPFPNGVRGRFYYRQTLPRSAPSWMPYWEHVPQPGAEPNRMPLVRDPASLTWLVNQAAIEMHPWLSRIDAPDQPDYVVFDLDILDSSLFDRALTAALRVREAVEAAGLTAFPKTTGGDGVHVYVPIRRGPSYDQTRAWALRVAEDLRARYPELLSTESQIAGREEMVLIDYAQNALGKTTVAPYSVRPRPGAPVSMPLAWDEVEAGEIRPGDFTMQTAPARIAERGDLFASVLKGDVALPL
jgi:bifunctional non-homologous end joining protein LigD